MKKFFNINRLLFILPLVLASAGCVPVMEYQKSRLNDSEMILSTRKIEKTESSFMSYREGSSGATGGKTGGGCGCN